MNDNFTVQSSHGSYRVAVGSNLLKEELQRYFNESNARSCFLFVDENVWSHHEKNITTALNEIGIEFRELIIPTGESSKSVDHWVRCSNFLLENGVRRTTPLIAIGGGITGDLSGFVAATTLRGIPLVHVPTTVLAMVDSSIGGKTGINHHTGKNLIGSFYQPKAVIADLDFLGSLPRKEWVNGLSEILKYGAIRDEKIFDLAEIFRQKDPLKTHMSDLTRLIDRCMEIKKEVVEEDEFEGGVRAILNFGHTYAHALEKSADFDQISHGEAVFLGMLAALDLSEKMGYSVDDGPIRSYRDLYRFQITADSLDVKKLISIMKSDKKIIDKHIRFILLKEWQHPVVKTVKQESLIAESWLTVLNEL